VPAVRGNAFIVASVWPSPHRAHDRDYPSLVQKELPAMIQPIVLQGRSLRLIADDIDTEYHLIPQEMRPALIAMHGVACIRDWYGPIPMGSIVRSFLAHTDTWTTPLADRIKAELRAMTE
jgi:hypothetical protein